MDGLQDEMNGPWLAQTLWQGMPLLWLKLLCAGLCITLPRRLQCHRRHWPHVRQLLLCPAVSQSHPTLLQLDPSLQAEL